jgi:hypothetical protein
LTLHRDSISIEKTADRYEFYDGRYILIVPSKKWWFLVTNERFVKLKRRLGPVFWLRKDRDKWWSAVLKYHLSPVSKEEAARYRKGQWSQIDNSWELDKLIVRMERPDPPILWAFHGIGYGGIVTDENEKPVVRDLIFDYIASHLSGQAGEIGKAAGKLALDKRFKDVKVVPVPWYNSSFLYGGEESAIEYRYHPTAAEARKHLRQESSGEYYYDSDWRYKISLEASRIAGIADDD